MKSRALFVFVFVFYMGNIFSQKSEKGSAILDSIAKSIRSKENLTIEWETSFMYGKEREENIHSAKIKGTKYYHKSKDITIICDGQFVYKYYSKSNKTSVSNIDTTADYNPIKVLTFFGSGYEIIKIKRRNPSGFKWIQIKTIDPEANLIQKAYLYFDEKDTLNEISFKTTGKFENYVKIKKLDSFILVKDEELEIPK